MGLIWSSLFGSEQQEVIYPRSSVTTQHQFVGHMPENRWRPPPPPPPRTPGDEFNRITPTYAPRPRPRRQYSSLVPAVLRSPVATGWGTVYSTNEYALVPLDNSSMEFVMVTRIFNETTPRNFRVFNILSVQNPFLLGCYLLKKREAEVRHLFDTVEERWLFHGTGSNNVDSICKDNLDWRRHGKKIGNRFGRGVSFSPNAHYSSHSSDKDRELKVMFAVRVLVSNVSDGSRDVIIPPRGFDTTQKPDGKVLVKFADYEFYPQYVIWYKGTPLKKKKPQQTA